jgi:hypothetical protein
MQHDLTATHGTEGKEHRPEFSDEFEVQLKKKWRPLDDDKEFIHPISGTSKTLTKE